MRRPGLAAALLLAGATAAAADAAGAQSTLERPALLPETWTGVPWSLEIRFTPVFGRDTVASGLIVDPLFHIALPFPRQVVAELAYAPEPRETAGRDDVQAALRATLLQQDDGDPLDLTPHARFGTADEVGAAGLTAARWLGPLRVFADGQVIGGRGTDPRVAAGLGAVWHPAPGRLPIALAGDAATFLDPEPGERVAWSGGIRVGIPYGGHTVGVFATNAGPSPGGRLGGHEQLRVGLEITTHVDLGRILGRYAPRETAMAAVRPAPDAAPDVVVPIREYRFAPDRVEIAAGDVVEWVNLDAVVHTASADDGAWGSGALRTGERWRATFHEPGLYTYHCGPHPYMRGVIVVR